MAEINELATALNKFQAELVTVNKGADNPFFKSKYADLGSIMKESQPVLTKHGLSVMQLPDNLNGEPALTTIVMHTSGQSQSATMPLILDKSNSQGLGSAITYARRYGYASALQIVIDEDDDGNNASKPYSPPKQTSALATPKQKSLIAELLEQHGVEIEDMKGYLAEQFGITDSAKMSMQDASHIIENLKK